MISVGKSWKSVSAMISENIKYRLFVSLSLSENICRNARIDFDTYLKKILLPCLVVHHSEEHNFFINSAFKKYLYRPNVKSHF